MREWAAAGNGGFRHGVFWRLCAISALAAYRHIPRLSHTGFLAGMAHLALTLLWAEAFAQLSSLYAAHGIYRRCGLEPSDRARLGILWCGLALSALPALIWAAGGWYLPARRLFLALAAAWSLLLAFLAYARALGHRRVYFGFSGAQGALALVCMLPIPALAPPMVISAGGMGLCALILGIVYLRPGRGFGAASLLRAGGASLLWQGLFDAGVGAAAFILIERNAAPAFDIAVPALAAGVALRLWDRGRQTEAGAASRFLGRAVLGAWPVALGLAAYPHSPWGWACASVLGAAFLACLRGLPLSRWPRTALIFLPLALAALCALIPGPLRMAAAVLCLGLCACMARRELYEVWLPVRARMILRRGGLTR